MARKTYDPSNLPEFSDEQRAKLNAMTDAELVAGAESDLDNRPMTAAVWANPRARTWK